MYSNKYNFPVFNQIVLSTTHIQALSFFQIILQLQLIQTTDQK